MRSSFLAGENGFPGERRRFQNTAVGETHADKHKCVPFLFARSSFRGLSKNMASEGMHSKDKKTQIRLRAPGFSSSKTWCWLSLASASRPPSGGGHRVKKTCRTLCTVSRLKEEGGMHVYYSGAYSSLFPAYFYLSSYHTANQLSMQK